MSTDSPAALGPAPSVPLPAAAAPVRIPPWLLRASDRLNPIIVKEVRQGLRAKTFWVFFALLLLACLTIATVAFGLAQDGSLDPSGGYYFYAFFFTWSLVCFFIIPYGAYRSLVREREDDTWVLLTLTGLGARRILRGKLGSSLVQVALYGSAVAPFVLFSYFLNGIDLPTILLTLSIGFAYMLFLTSLSVSAATLGDTRVVRSMVHIALLGVLLLLTGMGLAVAGQLAFAPGRGPFKEGLVAITFFLWVMASYGLLLFEAAAARLALPTEDYARGPRRMALLQVLLTMGIAFGLWAYFHRSADPPVVLSVGLSVHLGLVGMFLSSDRDGQAPCHRDRTHWYSLFQPGALRGFRLTLVLLALSLAGAWAMHLLVATRTAAENAAAIIAAPAYCLLYLSVPLLIARGTRIRALASPAALRLFTLILALLGCGLPPLIALLIGADSDNTTLNFFNPLLGLVALIDGRSSPVESAAGLTVLWGFAGVAAFGADRALAARDGGGARGR